MYAVKGLNESPGVYGEIEGLKLVKATPSSQASKTVKCGAIVPGTLSAHQV